jgi:cobalt/nickel transport system permease protein
VESQVKPLDTRVVVVLSLCLIFVTRSVTDPETLAGLGAFLYTCALFAGVNLFWLFARNVLVLPFTLAALPLVFTVRGATWFTVAGFSASREGTVKWLIVVAHCWMCYQILLMAIAKVGPFGFIDGLAGLGLPRKLVEILRLALRYLELLLDEASRLRRARALRGGNDRRSVIQRSLTTGGMVGTLFLRSLDRASRVQLARACRGGPLTEQVLPLSISQVSQIVLILFATVISTYSLT